MKKLLTLFTVLSLVGTAAPKVKPSPLVDLDSCVVGVGGECDSGSAYSLVLTGLDPHKLYIVSASADGFPDSTPGGFLNPDGDTLTITSQVQGAGEWTFTIYQVNHNGTPRAEFDSVTITFE